ncbi:restriction endonuclease subunit S [Pseudomonas sichuanensis]|uniref:restriction endonuclease subunit S n=1 Tax=Pseudomonas TaxID=286 RepID=UPI0037F65DD9
MSWSMVQIGKYADKVRTWNPAAGAEGVFQYVDLSSVDKSRKVIDLDNVAEVSSVEAPSRARQLVVTGDVLVATVRPNLNGVAVVPAELNGATASTGYCVLRADEKNLHGRYLFYWVQTDSFVEDMMSKATGANYPAVSDKIIKESNIPLPPLPEQKRIAAILDKADAIRRKRQQAIQFADDFLRAVFLDMFGDPVTNPKGWEVRPLIELIDPARPITYGILMPGDDIEGGVPYVRVVDMKDGVVLVDQVRRTTLEIAQQYKRSSLRAGDVLISIRGHVGRLAVVPKELEGANITQDTARLATNSSCSSLYLYACLENRKMQQEMQRFVKGAAVKGINLTDLKQLRIPVPPIELQKKIERKIELMTTVLTSLEQSSVCLLDGFKSLSQKAFSGQL